MPPQEPSARRCPHDSSPLGKQRRKPFRDPVTVDVCPTCHGIFLDEGEMEALTGREDLTRLLTKPMPLREQSRFGCPSCGAKMDGQDAAGVRIDLCPRCFGFWLDAGELSWLSSLREDQFLKLGADGMAGLPAEGTSDEAMEKAFRTVLRSLAE